MTDKSEIANKISIQVANLLVDFSRLYSQPEDGFFAQQAGAMIETMEGIEEREEFPQAPVPPAPPPLGPEAPPAPPSEDSLL